jgi:2-dehydro-3-deoxygluconokinase
VAGGRARAVALSALGTVGEGLFELGLDEADSDAPLRRGYGGDAANTAVAAVLLGADARLCSRVGVDALGRELLAFWRACGVDVRGIVVDRDAPTGIYVNERLAGGGNRFHYHRRGSAGSRIRANDIGVDFVDGLAVLHTTGVTLAISAGAADAARDGARCARRRGAVVSFAVNHRPALGGDVAELAAEARSADIVFISLEEAPAVLGVDGAHEVASALGRGPREVVVTLGAEGARVSAGGVDSALRAPPTEVVDAAGAGDALAGAYLASRLQRLSPERSLARAVVAASLSCRGFGCARSYPAAADVDAFLAPAASGR